MGTDLMSGYVAYTNVPDILAEARNNAEAGIIEPISVISLPLSVTVGPPVTYTYTY